MWIQKAQHGTGWCHYPSALPPPEPWHVSFQNSVPLSGDPQTWYDHCGSNRPAPLHFPSLRKMLHFHPPQPPSDGAAFSLLVLGDRDNMVVTRNITSRHGSINVRISLFWQIRKNGSGDHHFYLNTPEIYKKRKKRTELKFSIFRNSQFN